MPAKMAVSKIVLFNGHYSITAIARPQRFFCVSQKCHYILKRLKNHPVRVKTCLSYHAFLESQQSQGV